jgi:predicted Zn-dependent protease
MIDINKIKDVINKDNLSKFKIDKYKLKEAYGKVNSCIKLVVNKSDKFVRQGYEKLKNALKVINNHINKEKAKLLLQKINAAFTKDRLKAYYDNTKKFFTKENLTQTYERIKTSYKENTLSYVAFGTFGIFLFVTLGVSISQSAKPVPVIEKKVVITDNVAEEYYYKGQYDIAIEEYKKLQEKDADNGLWNVKIAEIYSIMGKLDDSKEYIAKAKEKANKNPEVLNYIIFTEFMNKDYASALKYGEAALAQLPKDKKIIKTMFTVYMANNMQDRAAELIGSYPVDTKSAYDLAEYARMLMILGQWEEGYKELRFAWGIDKDEYKIYDVLAQIAVYNKDTLLENITTLSERNPYDVGYKMWLAKIYSISDASAEQASKLIEELKTQDAGKIEIKLIEAATLQGLKQNEKADELIEKVIAENKEDYRILHTAAWYYLNKMDYTAAEQYCRESIVKNKNYTDNYGFLMPQILKAQGKTVEGEPYFRTAMYKEPYNYNIMLTVANYYWYTAKDTEKAMENFKFAELIKPNDPEIKYNMALIHISNNKVEEAIDLLKKSIALSDSTAKYHRTLGSVYLLAGNPAEAIKEIRYAYGSDETDIMTLNNAGCYYLTQDVNMDRAEYNLRKAQEGITDATDKYTADTIRENYKKVKDILDKYTSGSVQSIKIPELVLFY